MKILRRKFLELAGAVAAAAAFPRLASALDYPTRPVRTIAGFAAGGGVDITARLIGHWLTERLGQSLARKLLVALWKYVTAGIVIEGAVMKSTLDDLTRQNI